MESNLDNDFYKYKIFSDVFESYEGEAPHFGRPTIFLRFAGCDVGCKFCDEKKSWSPNSGKFSILDYERLVAFKPDFIVENTLISFTGGEPLQHPLFSKVMQYFSHNLLRVQIQTSGHLSENNQRELYKDSFTEVDLILSPKNLSKLKNDHFDFWRKVFIINPIEKRFLKLLATEDVLNNLDVVDELDDFFLEKNMYLQAVTKLDGSLDLEIFNECLKVLKENRIYFRPTLQQHPLLKIK